MVAQQVLHILDHHRRRLAATYKLRVELLRVFEGQPLVPVGESLETALVGENVDVIAQMARAGRLLAAVLERALHHAAVMPTHLLTGLPCIYYSTTYMFCCRGTLLTRMSGKARRSARTPTSPPVCSSASPSFL